MTKRKITKRKVSPESASEIKNELHSLIVKRGLNVKETAQIISEKYNVNESGNNLAYKIRAGTIKYAEVREIAELLNYRIEWVDLNQK